VYGEPIARRLKSSIGLEDALAGKPPRRGHGQRCDENKDMAESIASSANKIAAFRCPIGKRGSLAKAAAAPRCTAACAGYSATHGTSQHKAETAAASATSATSPAADAASAASASAASAAAAAAASAKGDLHAASGVFFVEEMEGGEADVGHFFFTEGDRMPR